jgi:hypothetical protein
MPAVWVQHVRAQVRFEFARGGGLTETWQRKSDEWQRKSDERFARIEKWQRKSDERFARIEAQLVELPKRVV